jgi:hypothetical protein
MNKDIREMATLADELEQKAIRAKRALADRRNNCSHVWSPITPDPIVREAYTDPGDTPGTMGVDWRGPCYVPRHETPRWKRTCETCGIVDYTQQVKEEIKMVPVFTDTRR